MPMFVQTIHSHTGHMSTSPVTEHPAATAVDAYAHFAGKLTFEVDPSDVHYAMRDGTVDFVLIDSRNSGHYNKSHLPGAVNVPATGVTADWLTQFPSDKLLVTTAGGLPATDRPRPPCGSRRWADQSRN